MVFCYNFCHFSEVNLDDFCHFSEINLDDFCHFSEVCSTKSRFFNIGFRTKSRFFKFYTVFMHIKSRNFIKTAYNVVQSLSEV